MNGIVVTIKIDSIIKLEVVAEEIELDHLGFIFTTLEYVEHKFNVVIDKDTFISDGKFISGRLEVLWQSDNDILTDTTSMLELI